MVKEAKAGFSSEPELGGNGENGNIEPREGQAPRVSANDTSCIPNEG